MALCKCGHEQSKHDANGCIGCAARCKRFDASPVITGEERVRRQEIIAAKLRQAQSVPQAQVSKPTSPKKQSGKAIKVWQCYDCEEEYDTKKEAQDCCGSEEVPNGLWKCSECDLSNRYDTREEAEDCTCEEPTGDSEDSGGGLMSYIGGFIGLLVVIIIAVSVVIPTVIQATQSTGGVICATGTSCATADVTTGSMSVILSFLPLMIAVVVLLLVVAMIGA